jgi:hypothetical protein
VEQRRTTHTYVPEESHQGVVPLKGPNEGGQPLAEGLDGRAWAKEYAGQPRIVVLCGRVAVYLWRPECEARGRWATGVPTATRSRRSRTAKFLRGRPIASRITDRAQIHLEHSHKQ